MESLCQTVSCAETKKEKEKIIGEKRKSDSGRAKSHAGNEI